MSTTDQLPEPDLGYIKTDISNQPAFSARQMREAMKHAPQPTQATQAEVTDEQINTVALEQWGPHTGGPLAAHRAFARAILALRPERVPMTDEQRNDLICTVTTLGAKLSRQALVGMAIDWTEAHHGITAQAKKEQA